MAPYSRLRSAFPRYGPYSRTCTLYLYVIDRRIRVYRLPHILIKTYTPYLIDRPLRIYRLPPASGHLPHPSYRLSLTAQHLLPDACLVPPSASHPPTPPFPSPTYLDRGVETAGVSYHVGVSEVNDHHVELPGVDRGHKFRP